MQRSERAITEWLGYNLLTGLGLGLFNANPFFKLNASLESHMARPHTFLHEVFTSIYIYIYIYIDIDCLMV